MVWLQDNGAWMCTAGTNGKFYGHNGIPYPNISALNDSEAHAWGAGETIVHTQAREWLIANKGFEYNCFDFLKSEQLPQSRDNATACAAKIRALNASVGGGGDRVRTHAQSVVACDVQGVSDRLLVDIRPGCTTDRVSVTAATTERRSRRLRLRSCSPDASTISSTCRTT